MRIITFEMKIILYAINRRLDIAEDKINELEDIIECIQNETKKK